MRSQAFRSLYQLDGELGSLFLERLAALIEERLHSNHPQLIASWKGLTVELDQPAIAV